MAKLQIATLSNLEEFLSLHNIAQTKQINEAVKGSIKTVSQSSDGHTLFFYDKAQPVQESEAVFSINLPQPVDKADKVKGAVNGNLAGLDANGNLIDSGKKAADFDAAGAANTAKSEVMGYVGDIPEGAGVKTIVEYIQKIVASGSYDDSALRALINANKGAIDVLNGTGVGSVSKTVADAIAKIVADAPESFNTLKEISDWISTHASDAAGMNSQITTNKGDIDALKALIGTLPDTAASRTIVEYIAEYVAKALQDSDLSQYAKAADLQAAVGRITKAEGEITAAKEQIAANKTAIDGLTTKVTAAEGKITALENDLATEKPKIAKNTSDIAALKGLVGEGYEPIPSSSIKALFSQQ